MKFGRRLQRTFLVLWCVFRLTLAAKIRCYKGSFSIYVEVEMETPESLITSSSPAIDVTKPTKLFCHGFQGTPTGYAVSTLIPTLIRLGTYNVCLVNWQTEASGGMFGVFGYDSVSVPATETVGIAFARALLKLIALGLKLSGIHLIGHSLGCHLLGYTGRETQKSNCILPWITCLDGARRSFSPTSTYKPIGPECAAFVDAVACDVGGYGLNMTVGHYQSWPNFKHYAGGDRLQPGCEKSSSFMDSATDGNLCSHNRCVELYNATLAAGQEYILEGCISTNYWSFAGQGGVCQTSNYIGLAVDKTKSGNGYLTTSGVYPYGLSKEGFKA